MKLSKHTSFREATRELARFASTLKYEELPTEVIAKCKLSILDTLGCCIFGSTIASVEKLIDMVLAEKANGRASIFGTRHSTSAACAALVNGTSAHAFQLDEVHAEATLHPGSTVVPSVFALSETSPKVTGRDALTAIVAGYEVGVRIGLAANGGMFKRGYHNQGTTGALAASAACARVLEIGPDGVNNALGLAGSQAAGLMAVQEGAMAKSFHSGRAAQSGVYAALLAIRGYTGITDVLDVPYGGFFSTLVDRHHPERLVEGLGNNWKILEVGYSIWPAANASSTAMETLDRIMRTEALNANDISGIIAYASTSSIQHCGWPFDSGISHSVLAAQMNLYYGLAVMALDRAATPDQFSEARIQQPDISNFIKRIRVCIEPKFDMGDGQFKHASRIEVRCRDGRSITEETLHRKGSCNCPLTEKEIEDKFLRLTDGVLPLAAIENIIEKVNGLEARPALDIFS